MCYVRTMGTLGALAGLTSGRVVVSDAYPALDVLLDRIEKICAPRAVYLYGSRARGDSTTDSDWDLKVVVGDDGAEELLDPMFGWRLQEGSGVFADVTCVRESTFIDDLAVSTSPASEIARHGILIKSPGASHSQQPENRG